MAASNLLEVLQGIQQVADDLHVTARLSSSATTSSSAAPSTAAVQHNRIMELRGLENRITTLQLQAHTLADAARTSEMTDAQALADRRSALQRATQVLQLMAAKSSILAVRFKDRSSQQTIPVEPDLQKQFSGLLKTAASGSQRLPAQAELLQWAADFRDAPVQWERHLAPIISSTEAYAHVLEQLDSIRDVSDDLARLADQAAASKS